MVSRRLILRTAYDLLVLLTVLVATALGGWKLLHDGMGLSAWGATLLLAPTGLITVLAAVYGYTVGYQRYYLKGQRVLDPRKPFSLKSSSEEFDRGFHRVVHGLLIAIPTTCTVAFGVLGDYPEASIFGSLSVAIALWSIPRMRALRKRSE